MFGVLAALIIIVCKQYLTVYLDGTDYTVSHRRLIDGDLDKIDTTDTLGELASGIHVTSGQNFKFAISFNKRDHYYPYDVSQYIGPIGIRMMQYIVSKDNGTIIENFQSTEF